MPVSPAPRHQIERLKREAEAKEKEAVREARERRARGKLDALERMATAAKAKEDAENAVKAAAEQSAKVAAAAAVHAACLRAPPGVCTYPPSDAVAGRRVRGVREHARACARHAHGHVPHLPQAYPPRRDRRARREVSIRVEVEDEINEHAER